MASGFIILKDRSCFACRWTGYDEILRLVSNESSKIDPSSNLHITLSKRIPNEDNTEEVEMCWGFINQSGDTVERTLDLRGLSDMENQLFWKSVQKIYQNIILQGSNYSTLYPPFLRDFLKRKKLLDRYHPPLEHSDWSVLAEEDFQKLS